MSALLRQMLLDSPKYLYVVDSTLTNFGSGGSTYNLTDQTSASRVTATNMLGGLASVYSSAGTNGYGISGTPNVNENTTGYTAESWFRTRTQGLTDHVPGMSNWSGDVSLYGALPGYLGLGNGRVQLYHMATNVDSGVIPTALLWYHVVQTWDKASGAVTLYLNGAVAATLSGQTAAMPSMQRASLGYYNSNTATRNNSELSHVAWYVNTTLSADRIKAHYQAGIRSGVAIG